VITRADSGKAKPEKKRWLWRCEEQKQQRDHVNPEGASPSLEMRLEMKLEMKKEANMETTLTRRSIFLTLAGAAGALAKAGQQAIPKQARERLESEIRRELITLPWYGVFDLLRFRLDGYHVTLTGYVTRPTLKAQAENVVRAIEGVESVTNEIEVLPLSPNDDRIRLAVFHAIYRDPALNRYALRALPPIHIIVKNGHVMLEGNVANEGDRNIAGIRANGVGGVFSVTNNLAIDRS
jgi:hyperosmotically inducible protein